MPRRERPLAEGDGALLRFARDLRSLRERAGRPTYRELSERAHYSEAALSQAAAGRKLPSLAVTLAYVRACGGSVREWEDRWRAVAADLEPPEPAGQKGSPYAGLVAFQPEDADRFFGRARLVEELSSRLEASRVVVVFGASGAGKSSLLRAGLIPRLDGPVLLFTPGVHPLEECGIHLARRTGAPVPPLGDDPRALHRAVRTAAPDGTELVIVVDQFEEVFTLCRDEEERGRFIDALLTAAGAGNSGCRVVLGVRADFYTHCTAYPDLVEALRDGHVTVGPMTSDELRLAITQPAVRAGCAVESALLAELVAQATKRVGVLPLLSHSLLETWRRRRGNTLTLAGYHASGGIEGALAQTAESVYGGLSEAQRRLVKDLLLRLTALGEGTEDTKRRVSRGELGDDDDTRRVLDHLADSRLIALDVDSVEISHEALIGSWPRLRDWLAEDREGLRLHRELTAATDAWEALRHDAGALYRGVRLERTAEWAAAGGGASLTGRERAFLDASLAAERAERGLARRNSRRLRQAVALLSALLALTGAATAYAVSTERSVSRQRDTALSEIVAGKAAALRRTDPPLAAQLSMAAYQLAPTRAARASVLAALPFPNRRRMAGHQANVNSVAFSHDGRTVVTTSHDRTARLWDAADPGRSAQLSVLSGHTSSVNAAAFRPDGRVLVTAGWDRTARLWDVSDRRRPFGLSTLRKHTGQVNAVAFSPDGRTVAAVSADRTATLWDVADPRRPRALRTLSGHTAEVVAVAFRPDGRMLATASFDRTVALWDLAKTRPPTFLKGHERGVTWVAFSPDGARLASSGQDGTARIWDPARGREVGTLTGHDDIVRSVAFSPDGRSVATAGEDRTARLWDVSGPGGHRQIAVMEAHSDVLSSVAFSPDGRAIVTGSDDDTAVRWGFPAAWPGPIDVLQAEAWLCGAASPPISSADWAAYFPGVDYRPPCR
ncbi:hypothetical protein [Actinomadura rubrisoli]|uniref:HTH cro/C1-type domain-containing protein n=1 Tax=Actinomadura rubrisoli TaxID=2530368 RepID=A0A4R5C3T0_9ACTN|nr:hypothetical protein [Actinomadura rubrisoli]TDD94258.1 hypothetical protein E1298_07385 [Actinomadura rubrisoli]